MLQAGDCSITAISLTVAEQADVIICDRQK